MYDVMELTTFGETIPRRVELGARRAFEDVGFIEGSFEPMPVPRGDTM